MQKYFLYARKSTDVEDKQVRSIDDQLAVLRALAKQEGLHIVQELTEKRTAKKPGRPVFNKMLDDIQHGEADGIIAWHPDRLSRNSVDTGLLIYSFDLGKLNEIVTPAQTFRNTPSDKFLFNLLCLQAKLENDNKGVNTKRGLHEKAKQGDYPQRAPLGYMNDSRIKVVVVDRKEAKIVLAAFELYAEGNSRLEDIAKFLAERGVLTRTGKVIPRDQVAYMLSNTFYIGIFRYAGEIYEGNHETFIPKKLFDRVQAVLADRGRPRMKPKNIRQPLCGLFKCGECGCGITAENKIKRQKNGNTHHYIYYCCTKKRGVCSQPHMRDGELAARLSEALQEFALPPDWAAELRAMADKDEKEASQSTIAASQAMRGEIEAIEAKSQRLLMAYLDQDIDRESYLREKTELLSRKKGLEEKIAQLRKGSVAWLEPLRSWIKDTENAGESAVSPSLSDKKSSILKISGVNLFLKNRRIEFTPTPPNVALRATRKNFSEKDFVVLLSRWPELNRRPTPSFTPQLRIAYMRIRLYLVRAAGAFARCGLAPLVSRSGALVSRS